MDNSKKKINSPLYITANRKNKQTNSGKLTHPRTAHIFQVIN